MAGGVALGVYMTVFVLTNAGLLAILFGILQLLRVLVIHLITEDD
jgi:hypothetical protein